MELKESSSNKIICVSTSDSEKVYSYMGYQVASADGSYISNGAKLAYIKGCSQPALTTLKATLERMKWIPHNYIPEKSPIII